MRNKLAMLLSWLLAFSSAVFPVQSWALKAKKDNYEPTRNHQSEIRWTKSLSKYYAKALISAQYEEWGESEFRELYDAYLINRGINVRSQHKLIDERITSE